MSVASKTTTGGGTFEDIVRGKKTYAAQRDCLVDLKGKTTMQDAKNALIAHCDSILDTLKDQSLRSIEKFYVGKACIKQRRKPGGGFVTFSYMDPNTWKKNGISSRWGTHKKEEYGRDGLIVLTAISRDCVLQTNQDRKLDQEQFALALEQTLIHHYRFKQGETRFENNTFNSGGIDGNKSKAYCVYVTFRLSDEEMQEEGEMEDIQIDDDLEPNAEGYKQQYLLNHSTEYMSLEEPENPLRNNYGGRKQVRFSEVNTMPNDDPCSSSNTHQYPNPFSSTSTASSSTSGTLPHTLTTIGCKRAHSEEHHSAIKIPKTDTSDHFNNINTNKGKREYDKLSKNRIKYTPSGWIKRNRSSTRQSNSVTEQNPFPVQDTDCTGGGGPSSSHHSCCSNTINTPRPSTHCTTNTASTAATNTINTPRPSTHCRTNTANTAATNAATGMILLDASAQRQLSEIFSRLAQEICPIIGHYQISRDFRENKHPRWSFRYSDIH